MIGDENNLLHRSKHTRTTCLFNTLLKRSEMRIEGNWFEPNCFTLGIDKFTGEDEHGQFDGICIGFLIISISIYIY